MIMDNRIDYFVTARCLLSCLVSLVLLGLSWVPSVHAEGSCVVRTEGFWGKHAEVAALFLPVNSCGLALTNVLAATPGSAIEDLCYNGEDAKAANTSPQQLQLIRQCTAVALNFAVCTAGGGSCADLVLSNGQMIAQVFDTCCDAVSLCVSQASGSTISASGCIELLDEFSSIAGIDCTSLDQSSDVFAAFCPSLGANGFKANPAPCNAAKGNGFVNPRPLGPR